MKLENLSGWVLLLVGLVIILWGLYSAYNVFTGKTVAPEIFKIPEEGPKVSLPAQGKIPLSQVEPQKEMEKMVGEQLKGLIPSETFSKLLNLISWSLFLGILIFAGGQIAGLGIKLIKK